MYYLVPLCIRFQFFSVLVQMSLMFLKQFVTCAVAPKKTSITMPPATAWLLVPVTDPVVTELDSKDAKVLKEEYAEVLKTIDFYYEQAKTTVPTTEESAILLDAIRKKRMLKQALTASTELMLDEDDEACYAAARCA